MADDAAVMIATDATFDQVVLARSHERPVLVDFWAPWCGPCRMLGPILERIAADEAERVVVAKLDTDDNRAVASRYAISSIPAVKLFVGGEVVAEFLGALPEARVRAFLDEHLPSPAAEHAHDAAHALAIGDRAAAEASAQAVLTLTSTGRAAVTAHDVLARVALAAGRWDDAIAHAAAIPASAPTWDAAAAIVDLATLGAATAADASGDPAAMATRFARAVATSAADPAAGLEDLLALVAADRRWNGEAARKAMLLLFRIVGVRSELSDGFRRRLSLVL